MNSKSAPEKYGRGLFNAFLAYRRHHGGAQTIAFLPEARPEAQPEVTPEELANAQLEVVPVPVQETKVEQVPEVKPETTPVVPAQAKPAATVVSAPVFKVQILTSSEKLSSRDARFKGVKDVSFYKDGGLYKYTVGESTDYNAILRMRREMAATFPQAFVIAFRDGERMDINEAIREFKGEKVKR